MLFLLTHYNKIILILRKSKRRKEEGGACPFLSCEFITGVKESPEGGFMSAETPNVCVIGSHFFCSDM